MDPSVYNRERDIAGRMLRYGLTREQVETGVLCPGVSIQARMNAVHESEAAEARKVG